MRRKLLAVLLTSLLALGAAACGGGDGDGPRAGDDDDRPAAANHDRDEGHDGGKEDKGEDDRKQPLAGDDAIVVTVRNRDASVRGDTEVALGDEVTIAVTADTADHVHVHGYDELVDIRPGEVARVRFTADIPGVFEVELEDAGLPLLELTVR